MLSITKRLILARVHLHTQRLFKPGNSLEALFSKILLSILEEEYVYAQSLLEQVDSFSSTARAAVSRHRRSRKISDYVLFCRYMKQHHPEQTKLQSVWNKVRHSDWQTRFPARTNESGRTSRITPVSRETGPTEYDSSGSKQERIKFDEVLKELLLQSEDEPWKTLRNIQLQKQINRPRSCSSDSSSESSDSD